MRQPFVAGNIKMNLNRAETTALLSAVAGSLRQSASSVEVAYCPPAAHLDVARAALAGSAVRLGAQNAHWESKGAFTGEVSPAMLREAGCGLVILGHSERRTLFGETDADVLRKTRAVLEAGLDAVVCVGETEAERAAGATEVVLARQVVGSLGGLDIQDPRRLTVAYEPVWAIGTGNTATPEMAQAAHRVLRGELAKALGAHTAEGIRIQYGGSVKPDNAEALLAQPDIDGALVGGACLEASSFLAIIRAGEATARR